MKGTYISIVSVCLDLKAVSNLHNLLFDVCFMLVYEHKSALIRTNVIIIQNSAKSSS